MAPSTICALKGGTRQRLGALVTTSSWLRRMIGRSFCGELWTSCSHVAFASFAARGRQAQMFSRPGAKAKTLFSMPSLSSCCLNHSAARASLPGGLLVSVCKYWRSSSRARSAYCAILSPGMRSEASLAEVDEASPALDKSAAQSEYGDSQDA